MSEIFNYTSKLTSFDKSYSTKVNIKSPKTYTELEESSMQDDHLISRGGGYSYAAASFKKGSISLDMKNFRKILHFDKEKKLITVEAGITMIEFLSFTLKYNLWISQIPGYPFISIGGAVAANIHGKSAGANGTIKNAIKNIQIFHKNHGWINSSIENNKDIFELTIGGYGLTGTIVSVTFKLVDFDGFNFKTSINKVSSITETVKFINNNKNNLIYSWNRAEADLKRFGDGLIFCNQINLDNNHKKLNIKKFSTPILLNRFYSFCLWNKFSIKIFNLIFFNYYNYLKKSIHKDNFKNVIFPFLGRESYFLLFGKKGFYENQILIDYEKIDSFIKDFKVLVNIYMPSITLFSIKAMSGKHEYLRFEGNKICLTFDVVNKIKNLNFINELDKLYVKYKVIPSIIKDSRIKKEIFNKCYIFADKFRDDLRKFDSKRIYRSELSDRLDL